MLRLRRSYIMVRGHRVSLCVSLSVVLIPVCFPPDRRRPTTGAITPSARSSYYNADTADLEIGQEFEDAEAEEEAALELQRASYKRLDPADYGEEEEEEEGDEAAETAKQERGGEGKRKGKTTAKRRGRDGTSSAAGAQGEALRAMKSDLEQIALGAGGEVCLLPVAGLRFVFVWWFWVVCGCSWRIIHSSPRFHHHYLYPFFRRCIAREFVLVMFYYRTLRIVLVPRPAYNA